MSEKKMSVEEIAAAEQHAVAAMGMFPLSKIERETLALCAMARRSLVLEEALVQAKRAMDHMGDILNGWDMQPEGDDHRWITDAFNAVEAALPTAPDGADEGVG